MGPTVEPEQDWLEAPRQETAMARFSKEKGRGVLDWIRWKKDRLRFGILAIFFISLYFSPQRTVGLRPCGDQDTSPWHDSGWRTRSSFPSPAFVGRRSSRGFESRAKSSQCQEEAATQGGILAEAAESRRRKLSALEVPDESYYQNRGGTASREDEKSPERSCECPEGIHSVTRRHARGLILGRRTDGQGTWLGRRVERAAAPVRGKVCRACQEQFGNGTEARSPDEYDGSGNIRYYKSAGEPSFSEPPDCDITEPPKTRNRECFWQWKWQLNTLWETSSTEGDERWSLYSQIDQCPAGSGYSFGTWRENGRGIGRGLGVNDSQAAGVQHVRKVTYDRNQIEASHFAGFHQGIHVPMLLSWYIFDVSLALLRDCAGSSFEKMIMRKGCTRNDGPFWRLFYGCLVVPFLSAVFFGLFRLSLFLLSEPRAKRFAIVQKRRFSLPSRSRTTLFTCRQWNAIVFLWIISSDALLACEGKFAGYRSPQNEDAASNPGHDDENSLWDIFQRVTQQVALDPSQIASPLLDSWFLLDELGLQTRNDSAPLTDDVPILLKDPLLPDEVGSPQMIEHDEIDLMQMQLPAENFRNPCDLHQDHRLRMDAAELHWQFPLQIVWSQIWWHNSQGSLFQSSPSLISFSTSTCIRCLIEQRPDLPTTRNMWGPYLVRPTISGSSTIAGAQQFLLFTDALADPYTLVLVHYHAEQTVVGSLLTHGNAFVPMSGMFDAVNPAHQCRGRAWCRIRSDFQEWWWPDAVWVQPVSVFHFDEINPPPEPDDGSEMPSTHDPIDVSTLADISEADSLTNCGASPPHSDMCETNSFLQKELLLFTAVTTSQSSAPQVFRPDEALAAISDPDAWPRVMVQFGLPLISRGQTMRIHRPNPLVQARVMAFRWSFDQDPVPDQIVDHIESVWNDLGAQIDNHWKLRPVHQTFSTSSFPDVVDLEMVLLSANDNTFGDFEESPPVVILFHIVIGHPGWPDQHLLKAVRTPPRTTALEFLTLHENNVGFALNPWRRTFHNEVLWLETAAISMISGDYVKVQVETRSWIFGPVNPQGENLEVTLSPTIGEASGEMRPHFIKIWMPAQSYCGEDAHVDSVARSDILHTIREVAFRKWPLLGEPRNWAPIRVDASFQTSPFLAQYDGTFIIHQFLAVPIASRQLLVAFEVLQIYGRIARSSVDFATILSPTVTGQDIIIASRFQQDCSAMPLTQCDVFLNSQPVRLGQPVAVHSGDFAQVVIRHIDMHSAYRILLRASNPWLRLRPALNRPNERRSRSRSSRPRTSSLGGHFSTMVALMLLLRCLCRSGFLFLFGCGLFMGRPVLSVGEVFWQSSHFDCMDLIVHVGDDTHVRDFMPISIADALGHDEPTRALKELDLPVSAEELLAFRYALSEIPLCTVLPQPSQNFHEVTVQELLDLNVFTDNSCPTVEFVDIYVDGSYSPTEAVSAWAFTAVGVSIHGDRTWLGWRAASLVVDPDDPSWIGASHHSAHNAELAAIFFAAWWALALPSEVRCRFKFDNLSAGYIAQGRWISPRNDVLSRAVRSIHQFLRTTRTPLDGKEALEYLHVKAHSGQPLNELVDALAKMANWLKFELPVHDLRSYIASNNMLIERFAVLWQFYLEEPCFPEINGDNLSWRTKLKCDFLPPPFVSHEETSWSKDHAATHIEICFATYNVSTLDPADGVFSAKCEYLREQLAWRSAHVVALQETRCRQSIFLDTPNYFRLMSAASNGTGGTQLWFSKSAAAGSQKLWQKDDFAVVYSTAETLLVVATTPFGKWAFLSAHAPHVATPLASRRAWWTQLTAALALIPKNYLLFVLGDFNVQIGTSADPYVGDLLDPTENDNGRALVTLLHEFGLFLPSTFSGIHYGPSVTWRSTKCPSGKRLDFVALPLKLDSWDATSWVDYQLDAGQMWDDHWALLVHARFTAKCARSRVSHYVIDRAAIRNPENFQVIEDILCQARAVAWDVDVHNHYDLMTSFVHSKLLEQFPQGRKKPRRGYISSESWDLWKSKHLLKAQLRRLAKLECKKLVFLYFMVWRKGSLPLTLEEFAQIDIMSAVVLSQLDIVQRKLKVNLRTDREDHFTNLVQQVDQASPDKMYEKLRSLGIGASFRKRGLRALPALEDQNGRIATSIEEAQMIWRDFASDLEFGKQVTRAELWESCVRDQIMKQSNAVVPNFMMIPSLVQLEQACRRVQYRKATGADGLVSELFHSHAVGCAQMIYPLMLKIHLNVMEPVAAKGGTLVRMWKGKGNVKDPAMYRGLLISNHISKILHSTCRRMLVPFFEAQSLPLQLGGCRRAQVVQAGQHVRSFLAWSKRCSRAVGVLFLDVKTAFYKIIRPLIAKHDNLVEQVIEIVERFRLPSTVVVQVLVQKIHEESSVSESMVSQHYEQLLHEYHQHTWFQTPHLQGLTQTGVGTRPGDPLADICFNFVFTQMVQRLRVALMDFFFHLNGAGCVPPSLIDVIPLSKRSWWKQYGQTILLSSSKLLKLLKSYLEYVMLPPHSSTNAWNLDLNQISQKAKRRCSFPSEGKGRWRQGSRCMP